MAVDQAKQFLDKAENDPALRKKVSASMADIIREGHAHGFKFSAADLAEHLRARWGVKLPGTTDTNECTIA